MYKIISILLFIYASISLANTQAKIVQICEHSDEVVRIVVPDETFQLSIKSERIKKLYELRGRLTVTSNEKGKIYIKPITKEARIDLDIEGDSAVDDIEIKLEFVTGKADYDTLVIELIDDDFIQRFISDSLDTGIVEGIPNKLITSLPKLPLYLEVVNVKAYRAFNNDIYRYKVRNIDLTTKTINAKEIKCTKPCKAIGIDKVQLQPDEETQIIIVR